MKTSKSLTEAEIAELPKLPDEWKWARLGEIHILKSDKYKGSGQSLFYVGLEHINKDQGTLTEDVKVDVINTVKNSFKKGDLLYGKLRPYLNKVYLANEDGVCSTDILVFESTPSLNLNYSKYFFLSYKFVNDMTHNSSGVNLPRVSTKYLQEYPFPLPPLLEQRTIVSKIEQLFSELDNGISNLKLAQEQLKVYRQAVLKKAFEGELTKKWREHQTDLQDAGELLENIRKEREEAAKVFGKRLKKVNFLTEVEFAELPVLPTGWSWVRLGEITYKIGDADHKMPKDFPNGIPYVATNDITDELKIDFSTSKTISKEDYLILSEKIKPEIGDIIFPRYGTIGKNVLVDFNKDFLVSYSCAIIKNIPKYMDVKYVYQYLFSPIIKSEIRKYIRETTQANVGIASIEMFVFPLCSLLEQQAIVQEIETRLSVCDKIEQDIETNLEKAEALRQSILKKAFEGKLLNERELVEVRGAEDWEPAEVLLERIRKDRAKNDKR